MVIGNQPHYRGVVHIFNDCVSVVVWYTVMCVQREEEGGCISDLKYDRGHKGGSFCSEQCLGAYYDAERFHINTKNLPASGCNVVADPHYRDTSGV